jgi:4-amino-4-deoxy-L-arabinose transferase-like glycosyltransferase
MVIAAGLRLWLIGHTSVAARDSIGFIRYALALERQPWGDVFRANQQHPGYPIVLLLVSWPVRALLGGVNTISMQLSAQIASGLASTLLVIPMYYLGRHFFDRRAGFWGSLLFQLLPGSGRAMSDGLSEATFLLFVTVALLCAVRALQRNSLAAFSLSGLFGGLAYLTRPEGALVVFATALVLVCKQGYRPWRSSWPRAGACLGALFLAALLAGGPYAASIGAITNKPTPRAILESRSLEGAGQEESFLGNPGRPEQPCESGSSVRRALLASVVALYAPSNLRDRRWWALVAILTEVIKGYQYVLALPVLIGLWWFRRLLHENPGTWVLFILCLLHILLLWKLAMIVGYVSERHILLLVLCGIFTGAAAVGVLGDYLVTLLRRLRSNSSFGSEIGPTSFSWLPTLLLAGIALFCLPDSFKTLHANRAGHRAAGIWLAEHTNAVDSIIDPFCWAHYYAGRVFTENDRDSQVHDLKATQYVVLELTDHDHSRLPIIAYATELAARGQLVYHWPPKQPQERAKVMVYAVAQP